MGRILIRIIESRVSILPRRIDITINVVSRSKKSNVQLMYYLPPKLSKVWCEMCLLRVADVGSEIYRFHIPAGNLYVV